MQSQGVVKNFNQKMKLRKTETMVDVNSMSNIVIQTLSFLNEFGLAIMYKVKTSNKYDQMDII